MRRVAAWIAVMTLVAGASVAARPADFCDRKPEHPQCATPSPTVPSATPTAPPPVATSSPSASTDPVPTSTPTPSPTPTQTTTPPPTPPTSGTATAESQAWWALDGFDIPSVVGHHIHLQVTYPTGIVDGRITFPLKPTLHDQVGASSWIRLHAVTPSGSNVERYRDDFVMGPCADCTATHSITVDVSDWPTGRHELRFTLNVPDEQPDASGAQRMFQSTGIQLCVRSCTPTYRSGNFLEARGWYDNGPAGQAHGYQNARLTSALSSVRSAGTISVRLGPGADGLPTVGAGVYVDPNFHNGSAGIVVREWSGAFTGSVTLPSLPSGAHRLVLVTHDGQNAGVLSIPFTVP